MLQFFWHTFPQDAAVFSAHPVQGAAKVPGISFMQTKTTTNPAEFLL
jgi:hypothetical protein